jgi:hypothetical protein
MQQILYDIQRHFKGIYSLLSASMISFIGGLVIIKYEILLQTPNKFQSFKFIVEIKTVEEFYIAFSISLALGMIISLLFMISSTVRKKKLLLSASVIHLLIFVSAYFKPTNLFSLILALVIGISISLVKMSIPLYIQILFQNCDVGIFILINLLFMNIGLLLGELLLKFDLVIIGLCHLTLILNIFLSDADRSTSSKCEIINDIVTNHKAWCSIILTIIYSLSGSFLEIRPTKLDNMFYSRSITMILVNILAIDLWGRSVFLVTSNLLVMIASGVRMSIGETPTVRSFLIWTYSGGLYPIKELFFMDLYPPVYSEYGMFIKCATEIASSIVFTKPEWDYKKSFAASFLLLLVSTLLYKEPSLTYKRYKIWE